MECRTKDGAEQAGCKDRSTAEFRSWEEGRSRDTKFGRTFSDNGKGLLAVVRS